MENVPFWLENKAKDRKRRAMVSKLMKGRKKYKWNGLSEEEESKMEKLLLQCENSPIKQLSPRKSSPRKSILTEISGNSNVIVGVNNSCDIICPESSIPPTSELSSNTDNAPLDHTELSLHLGLSENSEEPFKKSKEKSKRRSNSFLPVSNKCFIEESQAVASIDNVIHETCKSFYDPKTYTCATENNSITWA